MNFVSQIFFAIVITMLTGTLALIIWKIVARLIGAYHPEIVYTMLRIVCLLYIFPVSYICLQIGLRDGFQQVEGIWQMNFAPTGALWILVIGMLLTWMTLTIRQVTMYVRSGQKNRRNHTKYVPEEDAEVIAEFRRVKKKLKIRRNIRLYRDRTIGTAMTCGILCPRILIPEGNFSREQLSVMFHHEMMHCQSFDLFYKFCAKYIEAIYQFDNLGSGIMELLEEWSEYYCDARAITAISDEMDATRYFEVIVEMMAEKAALRDVNHIFSGLYEDQLRLGRRIDYMKRYENTKRVAKGATAMLGFVFAMMSVTTIYAAGKRVAVMHDEVYQEVEFAVAESAQTGTLEEFYLQAEDDDTYDSLEYANPEAEIVMPALDAEEFADIDWTVATGVRKLSTTFHVDAGQKIAISTLGLPTTCTYWIGIMDEWNNVRFVQGTGMLSHEFEIEDSGSYRVLVQNRGRVSLSVAGNYYFYTPTEDETETETE